MAQIVDGWAWIHDAIQRWGRATGAAKGAVDDDVIADACNTAQQAIHDIVLEVAIPWAVRSTVIDDSNLGITTEFKTKRLMIESDLGILDLTRVYRLWRVDVSQQTVSRPIPHVEQAGPENVETGQILAQWNEERWSEDGDMNAQGNAEQSILLYNPGSALPGGSLKITYWYTPSIITSDVFYQTDDNGDRTARPSLPRKVWVPIAEYAKLVILETTGDDYKASALWRRWGGTDGIANRMRTVLSNFQIGESTYVDSSGMETGGWV